MQLLIAKEWLQTVKQTTYCSSDGVKLSRGSRQSGVLSAALSPILGESAADMSLPDFSYIKADTMIPHRETLQPAWSICAVIASL
ncbi:hypothetical protein J6590_061422 [Homalodisca vitripennis]|nr:hypothetical protein J6590_061422 [Homalodisca vitripennis]